jgi:lactoylglutathione lyase
MKIDFITIGTKSIDSSVRFYEEVLGFTLYNSYSPAPDVKIAFMSDGHGMKIELIDHVHIEEYQHNNISIGFEVDDIEETKLYLEKAGVKIISGPTRVPDGTWLLHAKDPNSVNLGFVQLPEKAPE